MSGAAIQEKRGYTRFTLNAPATIWRENAVIAGEVVDISLGGAFIRLAPPLPLYEALMVSIHEPAKPEGILSDLPATVVRRTSEGYGVRFERMLLDSGVGDFVTDVAGGR